MEVNAKNKKYLYLAHDRTMRKLTVRSDEESTAYICIHKGSNMIFYERSGVRKLLWGPKSDEFNGKNVVTCKCCNVYTLDNI